MKKIIGLFMALLTLIACGNEIKKDKTQPKKTKNVSTIDTINANNSSNLSQFEKGKIKDQVKLKNGIVIKWLNKGVGKKLVSGEVVLLEYRLALPDGKIIDGNKRINLPFIPFVVGYNMQTIGWDIALQQLKVGDFVKVEIPAYMALGEQGIPGVVPPNSPNWLYLKIKARVSPEFDKDGIKTWTFSPGISTEMVSGRQHEVEYHALVSTPTNPTVVNTYRDKFPLKYVQGQRNIVPGLQYVLKNVKKGQKIYVLLEPNQAYGNRGYVNLIKPNEGVFYNLTIKDIRPI